MFCLPKTAWPPTCSGRGILRRGCADSVESQLALVFAARSRSVSDPVLFPGLGQDGFAAV